MEVVLNVLDCERRYGCCGKRDCSDLVNLLGEGGARGVNALDGMAIGRMVSSVFNMVGMFVVVLLNGKNSRSIQLLHSNNKFFGH